MMFIVALLISDLGYTYLDALFIASTYLPTLVLVHTLTDGLKIRRRIDIITAPLAVIALFILQLLLITLANYSLRRLSYQITMPEIVINPILVFMISMLYYLPYRLIIGRFFKESKADREQRVVEFVSNRKRVKRQVAEILYIESCDTEVRLHTTDGESYRNRTNISNWQRELGDDFVRIHRSYLVNGDFIDRVNREQMTLKGSDVTLPISRSYQSEICSLLPNPNKI